MLLGYSVSVESFFPHPVYVVELLSSLVLGLHDETLLPYVLPYHRL